MRNMFVTRAEAADIVRSGAVALFAGSGVTPGEMSHILVNQILVRQAR